MTAEEERDRIILWLQRLASDHGYPSESRELLAMIANAIAMRAHYNE